MTAATFAQPIAAPTPARIAGATAGHAFVAAIARGGQLTGRRKVLSEVLPFLALAMAAHLAAFALASPGSSARGGGDGDAAVSIEGAAPALAALIAEWEAPPHTADTPHAPAPPADADALPVFGPAPTSAATRLPELAAPPRPQADSLPPQSAAPLPLPDLPALPELPAARALPETDATPGMPVMAEPDRSAPPALPPLAPPPTEPREALIDTGSPPPAVAMSGVTAPRRSPQPTPRPERNAPASSAAAPASAEPRPQQARAPSPPPPTAAAPSARAAGSGAQTQEGRAGRSESTSRSEADSGALVAQWGGQIRAAIQRQQRHPAGGRVGGTVRLQLVVQGDGRLASVRVLESSGHAALDRAAIEAARRARLPRAPQGLGGGSYRFNLPVRFQG